MEARIQQIKEMEDILNRSNDLAERTKKLLEEWTENIPEFKKLIAYYESPQWMEDYEAYAQGQIPKDIRCGVLSEDLAYNALGEHRKLALTMIKTGVKALED